RGKPPHFFITPCPPRSAAACRGGVGWAHCFFFRGGCAMRWMKIVAVVLVCQMVSWAVADTSPQVDTALSDRDLFEHKLNLDHPGLEKVRQAVGEGDIALARQELADYYRHRTGRFMPLAPIAEDDAD